MPPQLTQFLQADAAIPVAVGLAEVLLQPSQVLGFASLDPAIAVVIGPQEHRPQPFALPCSAVGHEVGGG